MAKRIRNWNYEKYNEYVRNGHGSGKGADYLPWICIQSFPSNGIVSRVIGVKTNRVHHFMSQNELYYFYLLEWSDDVIDIREQYPLSDIERAMNIAKRKGVKYPVDSISGFPYVLTCDFMITTRDGFKARTIKLSSELKNQRTLEKLEIERCYWKDLDINWRLVTEHEISLSKARNIAWLRTSNCLPENLTSHKLQDEFIRKVIEGNSAFKIIHTFEEDFELPPGSGLQLLKYLIWTKRIETSLDNEKNLPENVLEDFDVRVKMVK